MRMSFALTSSPTPPHRWWLILILTLALWWTTSISALAHAQAPPTEAELVRVPVRVLRQCEQDAAAVDGLESRLRACQRDLDAGSGALGESQRRELEQRVEVARLTLRVAELERQDAARWSPWAWIGVGAGGALVGVIVAVIVAR
jgi:hypothetical protein